ncbi:ral guanine nucleotide dissociation stimulator-like 1 isoform X2 [Siniperca chuatsi]|uniref:ral guanine nucleotide dissociation stimulator-like 1 isoform X2 n=1 Tax=Siniperca chuatsi TaxID=119488 RepID=UPI001CE1BB22|nr:ral guanine nucleotide dissociation stimulator-like 1 isoform X2 [Siniperca chuatsi]XP_044045555.1 ral guanine nucleotide dissociation stimulator-like 1 isoform X2 [Siniperca chuatsi]
MGKWHLSMDPVQEWGEEEEDGAVFGITLRREPVLPGADTAELPTAFSFVQYHTVKVRRLKAATLERLVTHLLDPEHQEPNFIRVFLSTYRAFTSTSTLIKLLFQRDDSTTNLDNTVCPRSTLPPVIRLWLEEYSEDFNEPPQYQALRLLCVHLRHRLCFRRLAQTAETLLKRLQEPDCSQSASEHNSESLQQEDRDQEDGGETSTKEEDKYNFMDFPVREVAEQLTRLDAELFVRAVPFHCLGCVWSQRDKKENRNLAPTVRATISQFNAVTNRVITSLLCPPSPSPSTSSPISSPSSSSNFLYPSTAPSSPRCAHTSPAHRARIIERWIAIAQECRLLKNFSSLRAILSALQSNAVYRLKKTWAAVSRESMATFDNLCESFPDENCVLTSREILVEDGSHPDGSATPGSKSPRLCSASRQMNFSSGVVPYLGTYLTVLTMLDTALTDTVEGGLINFEKRRREFEILSQIRQLQASCSHYSLPVNSHITTWLQAHTLLTDQESYELSRDLEPPVDPCPSSPNLWSSRLLTKKLASLRTVSDSSLRKTHADQISVSSSGSSSSDMEDLATPQPSPLRLKLKSLSGSLHNVAEDFSSSSISPSSPSLSSSSCSSSHPDLSSSSPALNPESSSSGCSPQAVLPVYNKQVADTCIIRVSVECVSNGNVYKSILLTSQDHTPQVIQRALEKHHMEDVSCQDFSLCQMLNNGKELQIPDKANVFYAMSTSANYDFVLRQRWRSHGRHLGSSSSPGAQPKSRHTK